MGVNRVEEINTNDKKMENMNEKKRDMKSYP